MKIKLLFFLTCFLSYKLLIAQNVKTTQSFLIKGKINYAKESSWLLGLTDFLDNKQYSVQIQLDGTYKMHIPIEGMQDMALFINDNFIKFYVTADDTIEINWDEKEIDKSFEIKGLNYYRNKELQLNLKFHNNFKQTDSELKEKLNGLERKDKVSKYKLLNKQLNQDFDFMLDSINLDCLNLRFIYNLYYKYAKLMLNENLLGNYDIVFDSTILNTNKLRILNSIFNEPQSYKILDNSMFYYCPEYREFLFDYVRYTNKIFSVSRIVKNSDYAKLKNGDSIQNIVKYTLTKYYTKSSDYTNLTFALDDYYKGLAYINLITIRDWYIAKTIFNGFKQYSFEDAEIALLDFLPKCQSKVYKDTLLTYYEYIKKFKKGSPAPDFNLKDDKGKNVSLSDFKGKVIYLDFWGVGCGPCRYDIKNYIPKLHEKYHDKNIVFINICIDVNEGIWKKTLSDIKLDGVNLLAERWPDNQIRKDYSITTIPHYMLIDKYGKFVDSNALRPDAFLDNQINIIDKLLIDK